MDIKTKSVLLVLLIFTLGIICGFFLHSFFMEQQYRPVVRIGMGMGLGLSQRFDDILELSSAQKEQINPIIRKYENKIHITIERNMSTGFETMDSLSKEIEPYLSDKQKSLLENEMDHFKNPPFPPMQQRQQIMP